MRDWRAGWRKSSKFGWEDGLQERLEDGLKARSKEDGLEDVSKDEFPALYRGFGG